MLESNSQFQVTKDAIQEKKNAQQNNSQSYLGYFFSIITEKYNNTLSYLTTVKQDQQRPFTKVDEEFNNYEILFTEYKKKLQDVIDSIHQILDFSLKQTQNLGEIGGIMEKLSKKGY